MFGILKEEELLLQEKISKFFMLYGVNGFINYNDLYTRLTPQEKKVFKKYIEKLKKNKYVTNLLKETNDFNALNQSNRFGYLVALILIGKTTFASKIRNKAVKDLNKNKSIENIVKTDIDTYVNNDFRVSSKKIVNTVNKGIIQNKSVKKILMALGAIYAIERKKMKSLYITIDTKLNTSKSREKIKGGYYIYRALPDCCPICRTLKDKQFPIESMQFGVNAPPMHPSCRCWIEQYNEENN